MSERFDLPTFGAPTPVRFPPIRRDVLDNGLAVWLIPQATVPVATLMLILRRGCQDDPRARPGLASLTGDLLDEGAGSRDAIQLADAFARMGTSPQVDVGPDAISISATCLTRVLAPVLDLVADVVVRPRLAAADFERVRELRLNRLRQLRQSAGALADRAFVAALFRSHPYGHGALGTTASLTAATLDDVRGFWASMFAPQSATLVVAGDTAAGDIRRAIERALGDWKGPAVLAPSPGPPADRPDPRMLVVDRPRAPQAELRLGHLGPSRATSAYHALVAANAVLGGQFTSRINRRLREEKGVTYGARTSFDFRRSAGSFSCETSVEAAATADAVADILEEFDAVRGRGSVSGDELERAKAALTRGYVRNFETPGQLARAAASLAIYGLADDTFDRFVPAVGAITPSDVQEVAARFIRPADATVVAVGDAGALVPALAPLGRPVETVVPEF